jgi:DinB superfamily
MSRMARPASSKPDSRQTFRLLATQYKRCHKAALAMVEELTEDHFRWRASRGPQSIGWNLWHIARWDDYLAEALVQHTPSLSHLGPARQQWNAGNFASRWGLDSADLGLEDGGTGLADLEAAAMTLPSKEAVVEYAEQAFEHLDSILPELDDSLIPQVLPTITTEAFPTHDPYGVTVVEMFRHACEHLGTMQALKGMLGMRGSVTD